MRSPDEFAGKAGLRFKDPGLLIRALTHRSYLNEHIDSVEDNERLEFLGDAALDFLSGAFLYKHFPEMDEGQLTRLRSSLVRTEQLAEFARQIDLGESLFLGHGEELTGGRERPALLCAGFEAVMGALYLDQGIHGVEAFIEPRFEASVASVMKDESLFDARSQLQIWAQAERGKTPQYETVDALGPEHAREFVVIVRIGHEVAGEGRGPSKQAAAQAAAADALSHLGAAPDGPPGSNEP
jgi:ribonuclease III